MVNHKWDNSKSIVSKCLKCGLVRSYVSKRYNSKGWEYIYPNQSNQSSTFIRPNCKKIFKI